VKQEQQKRVELEKNMSEKLDAIQQQLLLAQQQHVFSNLNPFQSIWFSGLNILFSELCRTSSSKGAELIA
jgi:hypothetical protein